VSAEAFGEADGSNRREQIGERRTRAVAIVGRAGWSPLAQLVLQSQVGASDWEILSILAAARVTMNSDLLY